MKRFWVFLILFVISLILFAGCLDEKLKYERARNCEMEIHKSFIILYNTHLHYSWEKVIMELQPGNYKVLITENVGPEEYMQVYLNDFVNNKNERFHPELYQFNTIDVYITQVGTKYYCAFENNNDIDVNIGPIK